MNIVLFTRFLPFTGGREIFCHHLLASLKQQGHQALLLTTDEVEMTSLSVRYVDIRSPEAAREVADFKPNIINVHTFYYTEYLRLMPEIAKVPKILTLHGNHFLMGTTESKENLVRALPYYDAVVCVSNDAKSSIEESKTYTGPIHVIPPAINPEKMQLGHEKARLARTIFKTEAEKTILVPARFKAYKGVFDLLGHINEYQETYRTSKICFAFMTPSYNRQTIESDQEDFRIFIKQVRNYSLEDLISVFSLDFNITYLAYQACDAVLLPSHSEQTPLCLMEGMYYEKPVIATEVGGVSDLLGGGSFGTLIGVGLKGLEVEVIRVLETPDHEQLDAAKARIVDTYLIDKIVPRYIALYGELSHADRP